MSLSRLEKRGLIGVKMTRIAGLGLDLRNRSNCSAHGVGREELVVKHTDVCRYDVTSSCQEGVYRAESCDIIRATNPVEAKTARGETAMENGFQTMQTLAGRGVNVDARRGTKLGKHSKHEPWDGVVEVLRG